MTTQKMTAGNDSKISVNWDLQSHERLMPLWSVVAISLGVEPTVASVTLAKKGKEFLADFEERKRLLGRKLTKKPKLGQVTYFPDHDYNATKTGTSNRMVDVVSCIEVLVDVYSTKLSPNFVALKEPLSKLPLPELHPSLHGLLVVAPSAAMVPGLDGKQKKPPTSRAATIDFRNLHVLLYGMACGGYGYREDMISSEKMAVAERIAIDVPASIKSRYGLSNEKVLQILIAGNNLMTAPE